MARTQKWIISFIAVTGGIAPMAIYWLAHHGLGASSIDEFQSMRAADQITQVIAGLYIKPAYMLLSAALITVLLGQTAKAIQALWVGLSVFLAGEIFCAINFTLYQHTSIISEYLHSYGMTLAFAFITYALLEIMDTRLFHINNGHCALNSLCGTCKRITPQQCAARRIVMLIILMTGIASFLPLAVSTSQNSYLTELFGFPYSYARFNFYQWYETRFLPVTAILFFACALIPMFKKTGNPIPEWTKILFSAGVGALGFSLFRTALSAIFANNLVWFEFWEELTELMFVSAAGFLLWQFRGTLLEKTAITALFSKEE